VLEPAARQQNSGRGTGKWLLVGSSVYGRSGNLNNVKENVILDTGQDIWMCGGLFNYKDFNTTF
jgi:hypothetical protein